MSTAPPDDLGNRHVAGIAVWSLVALLSGGAVTAIGVASADPSSHVPLWPVFVLIPILALALYMVFATWRQWWPYRRSSAGARRGGAADAASPPQGLQRHGIIAARRLKVGKTGKIIGAVDIVSEDMTHAGEIHSTPPTKEYRPPSPPDFSAEIRRFDRIDREYNPDHDGYWAAEVDGWIEEVREKIAGWNPRQAEQFSGEPVFGDLSATIGAVVLGRQDVNRYPTLKRLHRHRERLRRLTGQ